MNYNPKITEGIRTHLKEEYKRESSESEDFRFYYDLIMLAKICIEQFIKDKRIIKKNAV